MGVTWTEDMVSTLRTMRSRGTPLFLCAERVGVAYRTAVFKARELGIAHRMNRGRATGESIAEADQGIVLPFCDAWTRIRR
jgi:hypothetical protein